MDFNIQTALPILRNTPIAIEALLSDLDDRWVNSNEGPETWSPYEVVTHLIYCEQTDWLPRARIILANKDRKFEPFDRFAHLNQPKTTLAEALTEFKRLRNQNLRDLEGFELTDDQLQWLGIHPALGEVTMSELLAAWVVHDLGHINQITRTMAHQYKEAVGPWTQFLKVVGS